MGSSNNRHRSPGGGRKEQLVLGGGGDGGVLVAPREEAVCRLGLEEQQKLSWYQIRPKQTKKNTF